jgi:NADH-quinone oxidoreductase subunit C
MAHSESFKQTFVGFPVPKIPSALGTGLPKNVDQVAEILQQRVSKTCIQSVEKAHKGDAFIVVNSNQIREVVQALRDDEKLLCQQLLVVGATDICLPKPAAGASESDPKPLIVGPENHIAVVYVFWSYVHKHQITLKVYTPRENPKVLSICGLYRSANWYERECFDMLGVIFEGHPDHRRILLPPDWVGHPLRKDYVFPEEYNGMKVPL